MRETEGGKDKRKLKTDRKSKIEMMSIKQMIIHISADDMFYSQ